MQRLSETLFYTDISQKILSHGKFTSRHETKSPEENSFHLASFLSALIGPKCSAAPILASALIRAVEQIDAKWVAADQKALRFDEDGLGVKAGALRRLELVTGTPASLLVKAQ